MKGDFSRLTFDPRKHYTGVLHQQGRVWLDSDWNEDVLDRLVLLQQELNDVIGPSGVPAPGSGFQISPSTNPNAPDDFGISAGHCYVNGNLCQLEANTSYLSQPDLLDPPRIPIPSDGSTLTALVYLEVWQRLITYLEDDSIREIALGGPDTSTRLKNIVQIKVRVLPPEIGSISCGQSAQFLPRPGGGKLTTLQPTNVQPQSLCQLPDPANFIGRQNHLYRVQVHDAGDVAGIATGGAFAVSLAADVTSGATTLALSPPLTPAQADAALRSGFVVVSDSSGTSERVALVPDGVSSNGSSLTLSQGLQNSYATPNDTSVSGGVARFKWSRDNAAFAVSVTAVQQDRVTLTLASLGRDVATALRQGDLVEISDDASELGPASGHLTFLATEPDPDKFTVVLADPIPSTFQLPGGGISSPPLLNSVGNRHLLLRRWDGIGDAAAVYSDAGTPGMNLGDGVHIQFDGQDLHVGDYWQFATRTADGSVEPLLSALPDGINRSWAPLAIVSWGPAPATSPPSSGIAMTILQNCLPMFPALINFPPIDQGIHIVALETVDSANKATQLLNDTNVQVTSFAGINVACDANVDPGSISRPTCFVTVEFPLNFGGQGSDAYFPIVLAGSVSSSGNVISWAAGPQAQTLLNQLIVATLNERGVLTRLTLKGNFIWSQNDPTLFLDGEAFGRPPEGNSSNVSLRLPSGDRRRGGNFEMWFWLVAAPSFITSIQASPPGPINVGDATTITMTLSAPAPPNSVITLVLSNSNVTVPSETEVTSPPTSPPSFSTSVSVPTGATSASVIATGQTPGSTTLSASFGGQTIALTLTVQPPPVLTGQLVLSPPSVFVGGTSTGTVTLSGPAPSSGVPVNLSSSDSNVGQLSGDSITVPAGNNSASFTVSGVAVGTATISASAGGVTLSALFTVVERKRKEIFADKVQKEKEIRVEKVQKEFEVAPKTTDKVQKEKEADFIVAPIRTAPMREPFIRAAERPPVAEAVLNPPPEPKTDAAATGHGLLETRATPETPAPRPKPKRVKKRKPPRTAHETNAGKDETGQA